MIVEDNAVDFSYTTWTGSRTASFTVGSGVNGILFVGLQVGGGNAISSVTYAGVAVTLLATENDTYDGSPAQIYHLINPPSGAHDIVVMGSSFAANMDLVAASYFNAAQVVPDVITGDAAAGNADATVTLTPGSNDEWIFVYGACRATSTPTAGGSIVNTYSTPGTYQFLGDTGQISPAAPTTVTILTGGGGFGNTIIAASFGQFGPPPAPVPMMGQISM